MSARFGPKEEKDYYGREGALWEWVSNCNIGVMGFDGTLPEECIEFVFGQYARFNIPAPIDILSAVQQAGSGVFTLCDSWDPYLLFFQISDVDLTDEWNLQTYEIIDGANSYEANPEYFETYRYVPGQSEEMFNYMMSHPGLKGIPGYIGDAIQDVLDGETFGEKPRDLTDPNALECLKSLCWVDGVINWTRLNAYYQLAAWASFAWLAGPPGRIYRMDRHEVFRTAIQYGEAIMLDGCVIAPDCYRKVDRPPVSCHICGISAWCTELTLSHGYSRYICEHCNSAGMPPIHMATCGGKRCMLSNCPHHPAHYMGMDAARHTYRLHGQLVDVARGRTALRLNNASNQMLLRG